MTLVPYSVAPAEGGSVSLNERPVHDAAPEEDHASQQGEQDVAHRHQQDPKEPRGENRPARQAHGPANGGAHPESQQGPGDDSQQKDYISGSEFSQQQMATVRFSLWF